MTSTELQEAIHERDITFHTNPMSRGGIVHWMLEEAGAPYEMKILDFEKRRA